MRALTDAQRVLVEEHLALVPQVLGRVAAHYPRHADREELAQAARLGLVEAAARFDADRGVPFGSWAALRVRGAILDAVRALDFAPRTIRAAERDVVAAREQLLGLLGRLPTDVEVAELLGTTPQRLSRLEGRLHRSVVLSLDAPYGADDGQPVTLGAVLVDGGPQPLEALEDRERGRYVWDALSCLSARLRDVLVASYVDGESYGEIARRLGVTESRVSQMRTEAVELVRAAVLAQYDERHPTPIGSRERRRAQYTAEVGQRSSYSSRLSGLIPLQRVG
ncbi:MAG: polymerase, sigma 28 subunit, SigD/FliA/WhiG [Frankiales bacterium]|nr:polymerase, sigma 28 subunit, SigD/FliA/WhiG [Frankiales bacterium]